jgi:hypothetical protein
MSSKNGFPIWLVNNFKFKIFRDYNNAQDKSKLSNYNAKRTSIEYQLVHH